MSFLLGVSLTWDIVGNTIDTAEPRSGNQPVLKSLGNMDSNEIGDGESINASLSETVMTEAVHLHVSVMHLGK